jgi:ATP-dependent RNA helicase RhlB
MYYMRSDFDSLNLHPDLRRAIDDLGFTQMTPIQQKVLRYTLAGHDAIGRAQTGTGKTAAFLISVINDLLNHPVADQRYRGEPRALILAPTRELALQIESDAKHLTKHTKLRTLTLLGGVDYDKQRAALDKGFIDIIVATPGRVVFFFVK